MVQGILKPRINKAQHAKMTVANHEQVAKPKSEFGLIRAEPRLANNAWDKMSQIDNVIVM